MLANRLERAITSARFGKLERVYLLACIACGAVGVEDIVVSVDGNALREVVNGLVIVLCCKGGVALGLEFVGGHFGVNRNVSYPEWAWEADGRTGGAHSDASE